MGKPCVAGAEGIHVDVHVREAFVGAHTIKEGDLITIDGTGTFSFTSSRPILN
jgi:pyruvate,orthophosphate dikinase